MVRYSSAAGGDHAGKIKSGRVTPAAFEQAIKLEQTLTPRDASLHNSYGWFLYLNKQYKEAAAAFEEALRIDPQHVRAKSNLEAAKKMMD